VKKAELERAHSEGESQALANVDAQIAKSVEGGNREGISILSQVDEGLEERRESAKLHRRRFQCDSYRAQMVSLERRRIPIQATFVARRWFNSPR
jgi:hypothetical protein